MNVSPDAPSHCLYCRQVGTPSEVYERPANAFVAGFVGVSNLLTRDGRKFTIRPEKILLLETPDDAAPDGLRVEAGTVDDVSYVGQATRFRVALDDGGSLLVSRQNFATSHDQARALDGARVRLAWREDQTYAIDAGPAPAAPPTKDSTP